MYLYKLLECFNIALAMIVNWDRTLELSTEDLILRENFNPQNLPNSKKFWMRQVLPITSNTVNLTEHGAYSRKTS